MATLRRGRSGGGGGVEGDVDDGELDELLGREDGAEGSVVELLDVDLRVLQREGVDEEEEVGHLHAESQRVHALC